MGRTGVLIALDILLQKLKYEGDIDIFKCIRTLREQRFRMVQSFEQYLSLYQAIAFTIQTDII